MILHILSLSALALASSSPCAPINVEANFNLTEFVTGEGSGTDGTWFAHEMMAITYLPSSWFYCVTANYTFTGTANEIHVSNYANKGKVNGKVELSDKNVPFGGICGTVTDPSEPAKLSVGPCKLPPRLPGARGPYWVVAAGPNADRYEWALVSGGQPTHASKDGKGCRTGTGINGSGLWIFLRSSVRDDDTISMVRSLAAAQGFDLSVLKNVTHDSCTYAQ